MSMHARSTYLIVWTLQIVMYLGGYCQDKHECLTWEINSNLLTLICRLNNFSEPVILIDNHEQEYVRCSFTDATCFPRHKSKDISIDNYTNTFTFTIEDIDKKNGDGKWKCKQGKNIFETEVSTSKGIMHDNNLHISGEILNPNLDSQVVQLKCYSCREPRKNNIEFLINGQSIDSIFYHKNTGECSHKHGNCKPQDCFCHPSGNEFIRLFPVTNVNVTHFSCYTSFFDNDKSSIFSTRVTIIFNGKAFQDIGSYTKVIKPPAKNYDENKRNKTFSLNTANMSTNIYGMDSKRPDIPLTWTIVCVSMMLLPPVILLILYVRCMITRKTDKKSCDEYTSAAERQPLSSSEDISYSIEPYDNSTSTMKLRMEITMHEDKPCQKVGETIVKKGKTCDKANETTKSPCNSFVKTGETIRNVGKPLVKITETTESENKSVDKTDETLNSEDKPFDTTYETQKNEKSPFDKTDKTTKSYDKQFVKSDETTMSAGKPFINTKKTTKNEDKPFYKTDEITNSEDKIFDITNDTTKIGDKPFDKTDNSTKSDTKLLDKTNANETTKSEDRPFVKANETTTSVGNPFAKTYKTTNNEDKPIDITDEITKREDKPFDKTEETTETDNISFDKTNKNSQSEDEPFDKTEETPKTDEKSFDKTNKNSQSEDKPFDKTEETTKNNDKSFDKTNKNSKTENKPFDKIEKTTKTDEKSFDKTNENSQSEDKPFYKTDETTKSEDKPFHKTEETTNSEDQPFDRTNKTTKSEDILYDKTEETTKNDDNSFYKTNKNSKSENKPFDNTEETTKNDDKSFNKTNENSQSEDKPFYKTDETTNSEDKPFDKTNETSKIEDKSFDKTDETKKIEDRSFDQTDETTKTENKPFHKTNKNSQSEDEPFYKTDETTNSEDKPFDKTNKTPKIEDKSFDKTDKTKKIEDRSFDQTDETTKSGDKPFDKTNTSSKIEDKPFNKTEETTKREDEQFDKTDETSKNTSVEANKTEKLNKSVVNPSENSEGTTITKNTRMKTSYKSDNAILTDNLQYKEVENAEQISKVENNQPILYGKAIRNLIKLQEETNETILDNDGYHDEAIEATSFVFEEQHEYDNEAPFSADIDTVTIGKDRNLIPNKCDACQVSRQVSIAARYWCSDCEEALCTQCKEHHSAMKKLQEHIIVKITSPSAMFRIPHKCGNHNDYNIEYCCFQDSSLCCAKCLVEQHRGCDVSLVAVVSLEFKKFEFENLNIYRTKMENMLLSFNRLHDFVTDIKNRVDIQESDIELKIAKACIDNKSAEQIAKCREEMRGKANESIKKRSSTLKNHKILVAKCTELIIQIMNNLELITKEFSAEKLYIMVHLSREYLESTLTKIIKESKIIELDIQWKFTATVPSSMYIKEDEQQLPESIKSLLPVKRQKIKGQFMQTRLMMR